MNYSYEHTRNVIIITGIINYYYYYYCVVIECTALTPKAKGVE